MEISDLLGHSVSEIKRFAFERARDTLSNLNMDGENEANVRELCRLRGELARFGFGPITDMIAALNNDHLSLSAGFAADAARILAGMGARPLAGEILDRADKRWPGSEELRWCRACFGQDRKWWNREDLDNAFLALKSGDRPKALGLALKAANIFNNSDETAFAVQALTLAADLCREKGEDARATNLRSRLVELVPNSDWARRACLELALDAWSGGDMERAMDVLRTLREDTREETFPLSRYLHWASSGLSKAMGLVMDAGETRTDWVRVGIPPGRPVDMNGAGVPLPSGDTFLLMLASVFPDLNIEKPESGNTKDAHPTLAHLKYRLNRRDIITSRIILDEETIETALCAKAVIVIREERSVDTGFLWLEGFEKRAKIVRLADPLKPGPLLRSLEEQTIRSKLFGFDALLIWGSGKTGEKARAEWSAKGLLHDARLDLLDSCDLDENGNVPPRSRTAMLAEKAAESMPDIQIAHRRRGEALFEKLTQGDIKPGPAGRFEHWLSSTRVRFPDAEWPFQLYARALEYQDRFAEAGIAWSDAVSHDSWDYRNYLGRANAYNSLGEAENALDDLRRASELAPWQASAFAGLSMNALDRNSIDEVRLYARIATEIDPDNYLGSVNLATACERVGEFDEAIKRLNALSEHPESGPGLIQRLMRRHAHAGRFSEALDIARKNLNNWPEMPDVWSDASDMAFALGDVRAALDYAYSGLERCGPDPSLLDCLSVILTRAWPIQDLESPVARLMTLFSGNPRPLETPIRHFFEAFQHDLALRMVRRFDEQLRGDVNAAWLQYRMLTRNKKMRSDNAERLRELLTAVNKEAPNFVYAAVFLAHERLAAGDANTALEILKKAEAERSPALIWELSIRALELAGDPDMAASLKQRLGELPDSAILNEISLLCDVGLGRFALELLDGLKARKTGPQPVIDLEISRCLFHVGEKRKAFELMRDVEKSDAALVMPDELSHFASSAAESKEDWEIAARASEAYIRRVERDSRDPVDCWFMRGRHAGVLLALGDDSGRKHLMKTAPKKCDAWHEMARIEKSANISWFDEDFAHLETIAPGLAFRMRMEEKS